MLTFSGTAQLTKAAFGNGRRCVGPSTVPLVESIIVREDRKDDGLAWHMGNLTRARSLIIRCIAFHSDDELDVLRTKKTGRLVGLFTILDT